jgi:glycogen(starch) synthase
MTTRSPLHVLMTTDAVGGVWTYSLTLAAALQPHGVTCTLVVMGPPPAPAERERAESLPNLHLIHRPYRLEWMADAEGDLLAAGAWLLRLARHLQPDLVHINGYALAALPWRRPVLTVAHSCVRSWWRAVKQEPAPPAWDDYTRRVRAGLLASTLVAAPTRAMAEALRAEYAFSGPLIVMPNGLPRPAGGAHAARVPKESYIFAAGRFWDEAKNLALLETIGGTLPWPVMVAGGVEAPPGTRAATSHVCHLGSLDREEVLRRMARAAIFVHPARYEPFGLSVLEAAQAGCALVLGDIPSLRECWRDAAVYVDPSDAPMLRGVLTRLIGNPSWCAQLGAAARTRAQAFDDRRMGEHYAAIYQTLHAGAHQEIACAS